MKAGHLSNVNKSDGYGLAASRLGRAARGLPIRLQGLAAPERGEPALPPPPPPCASSFKAHPERQHRVRLVKERKVQLPSLLADRPVLMAMRWTGKGCLYQPLFYDAGPPRRERMASMFAMAASHPDPVPVIRAEDALALARRLRRTEALA
jgi:hypothetical protein